MKNGGECGTRHLVNTGDFENYRCLVCGEILRNNHKDALIEHLRRKHPFINVGKRIPPVVQRRLCPPPCPPPRAPRLVTYPRPSPPPCTPHCVPCGPCAPQPSPQPPPCPPTPCPAPCAANCPAPSKDEYCKAMAKQQRKDYRTKYKFTIESWKPGCAKVVCPCCGCEAQPVIRRQRNQMANSSLAAILLFSCWPLSMLQFLFCESTVVNLYCAQCNSFLGAYNRKMGCVVDVEANLCNPGVTPNFPSIP